MDKVKLGVIGCGVISASHLDLANKCPMVEVVAVADLIPERAHSRAQTFGVPTVYYNDEDLLNDERIEAVVLAMPAGVRTPVAFKALERGKHVLLEKPVASNVHEVEKMIAMRRDRVVGCCSSRMTFSGHAQTAAACVRSGVLGKIRLLRIRAVHPAGAQPNPEPPPWRESMQLNGGGILVNWSCYELDYLMHIVGWQICPKAVMAQWWPVAEKMSAYVAAGSDADAHYTAMILCNDGVALSMERAEFSSISADCAWEIIGTDASLHLPMHIRKGVPNSVVLDRFVPGEGIVSETLWEPGQGDPDENVITDFVQAIQEHREPRTNLERALVLQKITNGIYGSAASGSSVAV
ncbi:MAG TPA: Gfo/Idh/MocA family oxidoreductase [bacterium]|nr:Gfo/Idh/MocA family oxidoreductase [bacterium]